MKTLAKTSSIINDKLNYKIYYINNEKSISNNDEILFYKLAVKNPINKAVVYLTRLDIIFASIVG